MGGSGVTRRDVLRTLAAGAVGGSVLKVIPAQAAEYAHQMVHNEKASAVAGKYAPKFFDAHQYQTLNSLCDTILPRDEKSGGAIEGGAPEFIDLLTSENEEFQVKLAGGLLWLDSRCVDQYGKIYLECAQEQRKEILDLIAFRRNVKADHSLSQGVAFFAFLRNFTCDGYYTSKIGIEDLRYVGNETRSEWLGCPDLPS